MLRKIAILVMAMMTIGNLAKASINLNLIERQPSLSYPKDEGKLSTKEIIVWEIQIDEPRVEIEFGGSSTTYTSLILYDTQWRGVFQTPFQSSVRTETVPPVTTGRYNVVIVWDRNPELFKRPDAERWKSSARLVIKSSPMVDEEITISGKIWIDKKMMQSSSLSLTFLVGKNEKNVEIKNLGEGKYEFKLYGGLEIYPLDTIKVSQGEPGLSVESISAITVTRDMVLSKIIPLDIQLRTIQTKTIIDDKLSLYLYLVADDLDFNEVVQGEIYIGVQTKKFSVQLKAGEGQYTITFTSPSRTLGVQKGQDIIFKILPESAYRVRATQPVPAAVTQEMIDTGKGTVEVKLEVLVPVAEKRFTLTGNLSLEFMGEVATPFDLPFDLRIKVGENQKRFTLKAGVYQADFFPPEKPIQTGDEIEVEAVEDSFSKMMLAIELSERTVSKQMVLNQSGMVNIKIKAVPLVVKEFSLSGIIRVTGGSIPPERTIRLKTSVGQNSQEFTGRRGLAENIAYQVKFESLAGEIKLGDEITFSCLEPDLEVVKVSAPKVNWAMVLDQKKATVDLDLKILPIATVFTMEGVAQVNDQSFWNSIASVPLLVTIGENKKETVAERGKREGEYTYKVAVEAPKGIQAGDPIIFESPIEALEAMTKSKTVSKEMITNRGGTIDISLQATPPVIHRLFTLTGKITVINDEGQKNPQLTLFVEIGKNVKFFTFQAGEEYLAEFTSESLEIKLSEAIKINLVEEDDLEIIQGSAETVTWRMLLDQAAVVDIYLKRIKPTTTTAPTPPYKVTLQAGINLLAFPRKLENWTIRDLAQHIGEDLSLLSMIIRYDKEKGQFISYLPSFPANAPAALAPVECGEGYIVVMKKATEVVFQGEQCESAGPSWQGIKAKAWEGLAILLQPFAGWQEFLSEMPVLPRPALLQNYPNPFNRETWMPFELARTTDVTVKIYDSKGQLVRALHFGEKAAGFYLSKNKAAYWNGRGEDGQKVASGVYFYHLEAGTYQATKKMVLLK